MNSPKLSGSLIAILPCNDLDASERFYSRLGFRRSDRTSAPGETDSYRMLSNGEGGYLHLTAAVEGWLVPGGPQVQGLSESTTLAWRRTRR